MCRLSKKNLILVFLIILGGALWVKNIRINSLDGKINHLLIYLSNCVLSCFTIFRSTCYCLTLLRSVLLHSASIQRSLMFSAAAAAENPQLPNIPPLLLSAEEICILHRMQTLFFSAADAAAVF